MTPVDSLARAQLHPEPIPDRRQAVDGKFLRVDGRRFWVKGVTYGTFAPDAEGHQFPSPDVVARDFAAMARHGFNTVRTYTSPQRWLLDEASRAGLRVMIGLPWTQHIAFLEDQHTPRQIRRDIAARVRRLADHPAVLLIALGNEIPSPVVRWHGSARVERFLRDLYDEAKTAAPEALFTYVNFPPTEYLDLSCFDVCAFNVYLHREADLRRYMARLQHVAGPRPLLLAEAGADSIREGEQGQADLLSMQLRASFSEGTCGAVAFAWTDEWWRGGHPIDDWSFGLVDRQRRPKPALTAVSSVFAEVPFAAAEQRQWPKVSVVVCAYNAADTIGECLESIGRLTYPDFETIVVNDGSRDGTGEIARRFAGVRVIDIPNGGLSAARNVGLAEATGEVVAYTDADVRVDPDWLCYLVQPFTTSDVVGSGGPNLVPADDPLVAQCVARAPGGPTHVLLDDRIAEHVPGCNMAFRRDALNAVGGFNPIYLRAGDDVDVCWRLQMKGWRIGFAPSALVWHRHRSSIRAYWKQQVGYGEGLQWLIPHHPEKFDGRNILWRGHIYSPLPYVRSLTRPRINTGAWGLAPFPSVYQTYGFPFAYLPHSVAWQAGVFVLLLSGAAAALTGSTRAGAMLAAAGVSALLLTLVRCARYAMASDLRAEAGHALHTKRAAARLLIAWLHFIQPLAQARGQLRGWGSSPGAAGYDRSVTYTRWPSRAGLRDACRLLSGETVTRRYWSERWTNAETMLGLILKRLQGAPATRVLEVDDGWQAGRDISVSVCQFMWMDIRALVEEHASGKCLVRIGQRLRPTVAVTVALAMVGAWVAASVLLPPGARWILMSSGAAVLTLAVSRAAWRLGNVGTEVLTTLSAVAREAQLLAMDEPRRPAPAPPPTPQVVDAVRFLSVSDVPPAAAAALMPKTAAARIPRPAPAKATMQSLPRQHELQTRREADR
jgi:GT2 family glycosyltransferase